MLFLDLYSWVLLYQFIYISGTWKGMRKKGQVNKTLSPFGIKSL